VATSPDARYFVGRYQFAIGLGTNNTQLQAQGLDAMVASGGGDPTKMAPVYRSQGVLAVQAKDYAKAEAAYARWAQLAPNDADVVLATAEVKFRQNKPQEALPLFQRAISTQEAAGQAVPENVYLAALQSALNAKMWPAALTLSKTVVSRFPNQKNWRNALLVYRQNADLEPTALLDLLRLMRAAKALDAGGEYVQLADLLARGRFYVEARSVVEEGFASGKVSRTNGDAGAILKEVGGRVSGDRAALEGLQARARTEAKGEFALRIAEGLFGHGDYAKAADLYRVALQKGGVDSNLVNTRLGIALAMAGQRAEADAAFKAVTGPRTALASYWLLWLSQRA
jgi:predicted Zn-dependent protease